MNITEKVLILLVVMSILAPLLSNSDASMPLYFIDENIREFTSIIQQDSLIYAIGGDHENQFFYSFDHNLSLKLKKRISNLNSKPLFYKYKQGFLIKNLDDKDSILLYIDKKGNILNSYVLEGNIKQCVITDQKLYILLQRQRTLYTGEISRQLENQSESKLTAIKDSVMGKDFALILEDEFNYLITLEFASYLRKFDKQWNMIDDIILNDSSKENYYSLKRFDNHLILDMKYASWLFKPERFEELNAKPPPDQVLFYDLEGNLTQTIDIPRKYNCSSDYVYEQNVFIQQTRYRDTLFVVDVNGSLKREIDLDFSFEIKDYMFTETDALLLCGSSSQCYYWDKSGLLMLSMKPIESLNFYPVNNDATLLNEAFETQSEIVLKTLMDNWYENTKQPKTEFEQIWEKEVYALYQLLFPSLYYNGRNQYRYGSDNSPYYDPLYHLIPYELTIEIADSIYTYVINEEKQQKIWLYQPTGIKHKIIDFRPQIDEDIKVIYATKEIDSTVKSYLAFSQKDKRWSKRKKFIKDYTTLLFQESTIGQRPIFYGFYDLNKIIFDKNYQKAIIRPKHRGRYYFQKENGTWKIVK